LSFWKNPLVTDDIAFQLQLLMPNTGVSHDTENAQLSSGQFDLNVYSLGTPQAERDAMNALQQMGMAIASPNRAGQFRSAWGTLKNVEAGVQQLIKLPALEKLHINSLHVDSGALNGLEQLEHLRDLSIYPQDFKNLDLGLLHRVVNLQKLRLNGRNLNDALAQLDGLPKLISLDVTAGDPSTDWPKYLQRLTQLETLRATAYNPGDFEVTSLAALSNLRTLSIHGPRWTDEHLKSFSRPPNLQRLSLLGTSITDASVPVLSNWQGLITLNISRTQFTEQGLAQLHTALPRTQIIASDLKAAAASPNQIERSK
jgi:hypothetical protein